MRLDLINFTDDNYYFTTGVRPPNIQDIISFDKNNELIDVNTYHKMEVIKHIIRFDEDHIYLVSLKKKKVFIPIMLQSLIIRPENMVNFLQWMN